MYPHADYVTVNISSPNTKNLRACKATRRWTPCSARIAERREVLAGRHGKRVPIFVKIAPDLDDTQVEVIAATLKRHAMDGVVATNTTLSRDAVKGLRHAEEAGGLSGAPVLEASNRVIGQLRAALGKGFPIIGVGGVMSGTGRRVQDQGGRRRGADLHRPDLQRPGTGRRSRKFDQKQPLAQYPRA